MAKQKRKTKDKFFTKRSVLGYIAGGGAYFWSSWLIITFGAPHIGLWWANIIGNVVGIFLNYLAQSFLAFPGKNILNSGWKFVVLSIANLAISYLILSGLQKVGIPLWLAQFFSAGFFTIWNYAWYKLWVFKEKS